jgi:hypothetical protein
MRCHPVAVAVQIELNFSTLNLARIRHGARIYLGPLAKALTGFPNDTHLSDLQL